MKKQTLILAAGLTLASLLLSGCGNDSKFNTAKDNFLKLAKEFNNIELSSAESCTTLHSKYKNAYNLMLKADKELKVLNELVKSDPDLKKIYNENIKTIDYYDVSKNSLKTVGIWHKMQHKCTLDGINTDF